MDAQPSTPRRWLVVLRDHRREAIAALMWLALLAFAGYVYLGRLPHAFIHRVGIHAVTGMGGDCSSELDFSERDMRDEHVDVVSLPGTKPRSFHGLKHLRRFPALKEVHLGGSSVKDDDLRNLRDIQHVAELTLHETDVGDAGFREIGTLKGLEKLDAWDTKVTDAGVAHLSGCRSLQVLWLDGCRVRGNGFDGLKDSRIANLTVSSCPLEGLTSIARMKSLIHLEAADCGLDDESLIPLRDAPLLAELDLEYNPLTDQCIEHLAAIPRLTTVYLDGTQVTADGVRRLQQLRPELYVVMTSIGD